MKKLLAIVVLLIGITATASAREGEPGGHGICKQVGKLIVCPLM